MSPLSSNPIGSNWTYPLGKTVITASQVGVPISVPLGGSFQQAVWIEASNETPYILSIFSAQGILLNQIQPQLQDIAQIPSGDSSFILVASLLLPQASPSSEVDINVYPFGKPTGAYPIPLARQATSIGPESTNNGYTLVVALVLAANATGGFAVNNPTGSGKIMTFYQNIVSVIVAINQLVEFGWLTGTTNLGTNITSSITPNLSNNPIVSIATASSRVSGGMPSPNPWNEFSVNTIPYNMVQYPDKKQLTPGNSVDCIFSTGATGTTFLATISWNEQ